MTKIANDITKIGIAQPMADDPSDPNPEDYAHISDEQLNSAIAGEEPVPVAAGDTDDDDEDEKPAPKESKKKPAPEVEVEDDTDEDDEDEEEDQEAGDEGEESEGAPSDSKKAKTDEPYAFLKDLPEQARDEVMALDAKSKHFEAVAGRHAGQADHYKKKWDAAQREIAALKKGDGESFAGDEKPAQATSRQDQLVERQHAYLVEQAIVGGVQRVLARHADAKQFNNEIQKHLETDPTFDEKAILESDDPKEAARLMESAVESAYWAVVAQRRTDSSKAPRQKKGFDQAERSRARKLASADVKSSVKKPSAKQVVKKTLGEVTDAELDNFIDRKIAAS